MKRVLLVEAELDMEYHLNLATALAANGDYPGARAEVQGVLAANPNYEPARALWQR
jgi:hypothetical protein